MKLLEGLSSKLGHQLQAHQLRLCCAESCTGGLLAAAVTRIPGSSHWFEAGFVCYSNRLKHRLLNVPNDVLEAYGAVSEQVVKAMSYGARTLADAHLAVAVSGIAGPTGGQPSKPVGTVWFCWDLQGQKVITASKYLKGDRQDIREQAVVIAIEGCIAILP